jgi:hypothetical protein
MRKFLSKLKNTFQKEKRYGSAPAKQKGLNLEKEAKEFIRIYGDTLESLSRK